MQCSISNSRSAISTLQLSLPASAGKVQENCLQKSSRSFQKRVLPPFNSPCDRKQMLTLSNVIWGHDTNQFVYNSHGPVLWYFVIFFLIYLFSDCVRGSSSFRVTWPRPRVRSTGWGWTSSRRPLATPRGHQIIRGHQMEVTRASPRPRWPPSASAHLPQTLTDNTSDL